MIFLAAVVGAFVADRLTGNLDGWRGFLDRQLGVWIGMLGVLAWTGTL